MNRQSGRPGKKCGLLHEIALICSEYPLSITSRGRQGGGMRRGGGRIRTWTESGRLAGRFAEALLAGAVAVGLAACGDIRGISTQPEPEGGSNHAPLVELSGADVGIAGDTLRVAALAIDIDGDPLSFAWNSSEESDVLLSPDAAATGVILGVAGERLLQVQVSDGDTTVIASRTTRGVPPAANHAPIVELLGVEDGAEGDTLWVSALAIDLDGDPLSFFWNSSDVSDVITGPDEAATGIVLGDPGSRLIQVQVSDGHMVVTSSLTTRVIPVAPAGCVPVELEVPRAAESWNVALNQPWVTGFPRRGEPAPAPRTVPGTLESDGVWGFDLRELRRHVRLRPHRASFDAAEPDSACFARMAPGLWVPSDAVFRVGSDDGATYLEWLPVELCEIRFGAVDDSTSIEASLPYLSFFSPFDSLGSPSATVAGEEVATDLWRYDLTPFTDFPFFNWHRELDVNEPGSCWADPATANLPAEAVFELIPRGGDNTFGWRPNALECPTGTFPLGIQVARRNRTMVHVRDLPDGSLLELNCFGPPGVDLPWTVLVATVQAEVAQWNHTGLLDERYLRWSLRRVDTGDDGCAVEGEDGVICFPEDGCFYQRFFD